jgi:hypothetical protein
MERLKFKFGFALLFAAAFLLASCGGGGQSHEGHDHDNSTTEQTDQGMDQGHDHSADSEASGEKSSTDGMGPEYTSAYVCPMHCKGSGSDQPGNCPVCGMDYIARAEHEANGHTH